MSVFSEATWGPEWVSGLSRVFSPGEQLTGYSRCYTEVWHERWNSNKGRTERTFGGLVWRQIALTNANVWWMRWRTERVRTGFLSSKLVTHPEAVESMSVPIGQVASLSIRRVSPAYETRAHLKRLLGSRPAAVARMELSYAGGAVEVFSPYSEFETLVSNLQHAMTGSALARQSSSVADAVTRLSELRRDGLLTDEEFERAKSGFVGSSIEVTETSAGLIRQLAQLRDAGILDDAEFRIKKWDILSRPG